MTLLRLDMPEGTELVVKNTRTGDVEEARVANNNIVREKDGPAAYSVGPYEIVEIRD